VDQLIEPRIAGPAPIPVETGGGHASPSDRSAETTAFGTPWQEFAAHRRATKERWPYLWDVRVTKDHLDGLRHVGDPAAVREVLDVGATDRRHRSAIEHRFPDATYRSLDIDRTLPQDYHDFAELDRSFDVVLCLEVLEHVPEAVGLAIVRDCVAACRPGGHVLFSVPNCLIPYYQSQFTHCTNVNYLDLATLCRIGGLEVVDMARVASGSRRTRWAHRWIFGRFHRFMRTDWCGAITCLGRRPEVGDADS
jgi:SAM-dependent methyltransferase